MKVVGNMAGETGASVPEKKCLQMLYFSLFPLADFFSLSENNLINCFSVPVAEQRKLASKDAHCQDMGTTCCPVKFVSLAL